MPPKRKHHGWIFGDAPWPTLKKHLPRINDGEHEPLSSNQRPNRTRPHVRKGTSLNKNEYQPLPLQSEDSEELRRNKLQIQALFQYNLSQHQDQRMILHSALPLKGVDEEKQQQQMYNLIPQQNVVHQASARHLLDEGVCSRRLMQYIYHLRNRPPDNNLAYWRKFVAEYYAPCAKKRWCLSSYDEVGHDALGFLPNVMTVPGQCNICRCKSRRGFEAIFEVLPRLSKIKFGSGMIDELLFLGLPRESRFPSGLMLLEYGRAVQESVYEQNHIVHDGQLRIVFSHDLKILSWEFCICSHDIFLRRTAVAPQVIQLVHSIQDFNFSIDDRRSDGVWCQDPQENCNMILEAGGQLAITLDQQVVDDLGFSKRYTRCLQIAEIVQSMKDLMTLCHHNDAGPIECLKSYCRETASAKLRKPETKGKGQLDSAQDPLKENNKMMASSCDFTIKANGSSLIGNGGLLTSTELEALLLRGSHHKTIGQSNLTCIASKARKKPHIEDTSSELSQGPKTSNFVESGLLGLDSSLPPCAIQKLVQDMINNSRSGDKPGKDLASAAAAPGNVVDIIAGRTSSSRGAWGLSEVYDINCSTKRDAECPGKLHLPEPKPISYGYHDHNTIYGNGTGNDNDMGYAWKP